MENGITSTRQTSGLGASQELSSLVCSDEAAVAVQQKDARCLERVLRFLKDNLLMALSVLAVGIGFIVGFAVRPQQPSEQALMWLG